MKILIMILMVLPFTFHGQILPGQDFKGSLIGINIGISSSYTDKAYLIASSIGLTIEHPLHNGFRVALSPNYSWMHKWNEHYLNIPIHIKKTFNPTVNIYLGPCITWDLGYFRSFGVSGGLDFTVGNKSSITLSAYTFTLYSYQIDYLYVPVRLSYNLLFSKK